MVNESLEKDSGMLKSKGIWLHTYIINNVSISRIEQMIYEKWHIRKLPKTKDTDCKRNDTKSLESNKQVFGSLVLELGSLSGFQSFRIYR